MSNLKETALDYEHKRNLFIQGMNKYFYNVDLIRVEIVDTWLARNSGIHPIKYFIHDWCRMNRKENYEHINSVEVILTAIEIEIFGSKKPDKEIVEFFI